MKKLKVALLLFLMSIVAVVACGCDEPSYIVDDNVVASSYSAVYDVQSDNLIKVEQTFDIRYATPSHGIIVDIAVNGGEKVRNLKVDGYEYSLGHEGNGGLVYVKIGSSDYLVSGTKTYTLTYDYILPNADAKKFAFTPIGAGYSFRIERANVTLNFPNEVPSFRLDTYYAPTGAKNEITASGRLSNNNKTLTFSAADLTPYTGVTVDVDFGAAVFSSRADTDWIATAIICALIIAALILVKIFACKNKTITPIVEFYPPQDENGNKMLPVQLGKLIDNSCSNEDVTSFIFYWASKGYLSIGENNGSFFLKKERELTKPVTSYESEMFEKLFALGKGELGNEVVREADLKGKFSPTVEKVKARVNSEYKGQMYKKSNTTLSLVSAALTCLALMGIIVFAYMRVSTQYFNGFGLITIFPLAIAYMLGMYISHYHFKISKVKRISLFVALLVLSAAVGVCTALLINGDVMSIFERVMIGATMFFGCIVPPFMYVRTERYNKNLESIIGFRDFLRDAEKDRLETLLAENPQYYYDILPYANVLGVSDIWEKKFESMTIEPPRYYASDSVFDLLLFNHFYRRSLVNMRQSFAPPRSGPNSPSGGSFSGGGGGGGHFGGGGGRSW